MKAGYFAIIKNAFQRRWASAENISLKSSKLLARKLFRRSFENTSVKPSKSLAWKLINTIIVGVVVGTTYVDTVGFVAVVSGLSMQPTFNPDPNKTRDKVFLSRWAMRNFELQRGDIVTLKNPKDCNVYLIKRVVGFEGDIIRTTKKKEIEIPKGHCWVEGDNIKHSYDSNNFGCVPIGLIIAKATRIVWPPTRMGKLPHTEIHDDRFIVKQSAKVTLFL